MMSWRHFNVWVWCQVFLLWVPCVEEHNGSLWLQAGHKFLIGTDDCHWFFVMVWIVLDVSSKMLTLVGIDECMLHARNVQSLIKYQDIIAPVRQSIPSRQWDDWDILHWGIIIRKGCYVATTIGISQYCKILSCYRSFGMAIHFTPAMVWFSAGGAHFFFCWKYLSLRCCDVAND